MAKTRAPSGFFGRSPIPLVIFTEFRRTETIECGETHIAALPCARFRLVRNSGQTALCGRASLINLRKKQSNATFLSDTGKIPKRQIGVSFFKKAVPEKLTR